MEVGAASKARPQFRIVTFNVFVAASAAFLKLWDATRYEIALEQLIGSVSPIWGLCISVVVVRG